MKRTKQFLMALMLAITVLGSFPFTDALAGCPVSILPGNGSTSGNARAPLGNFRFERGVYLITAAEIAAAGFSSGQTINTIQWSYSTGHNISVTGNLQVWFENTSDVTTTKSTTWATAVATMSNAHNASATIPAGTTFGVTLTGAPFTYTGGGLYVGYEWSNAANPLSVGAVVLCTNQPVLAMLNSQQSNISLPTTLAAASNFRPQTVISASGLANDASVTNVYGLGNMAVGYNTNYAIRALVYNPGNNTQTNLNVTLNISGANSFSDVQVIPSLAPCTSTLVTFAGFSPSAIGANTVSVSVPSDDNGLNNTSAYAMSTSKDITSFRYIAPITGGVGFTGATGDFLGKFTAANNFGNSDTINGFEVIFTTTGQPYNVGIWTDVAGSPGTNIYTSGSQLTVADTVFISLPDVEVSGNYWIGIRQTGTTNVGFGFQTENPVRATEFKYTSPTGNTIWTDFSPAANFRISATVQYKTPQPPNCAVYLSPANASVSCQNGVTLNYGSGGGGPTGYRVYFGTNQALVESEDPGTLVQNSAATSYATGALTPGGTYYWRVTAYNGIGDASGCAILSRSFTTNLASCYCATTATNGTFEHVTNVQSGAFSNPSGSTLYSNNTGLGAINNVNINSTFNITVTIDPLNIFDEDRIYVFADFNQDGDFTDVGELCGNTDVTIAGGNVYVVPVTVPASASAGNTLLRIKFGDEVSTTAMTNDPCQVSYTFGEVEDYLLNITCGASATASTPACENGIMNFTSTYYGNSTPSSYSWSGPNGFSASIANPSIPSLTLLDGGTYTVTITDAAACVSSASVTFAVSPEPVITVSSNTPVCEGSSINFNSSGGVSYSWSGPGNLQPTNTAQNPFINSSVPGDAGLYTVVVTDAFGCTASGSETIVVNPLPVLNIVSQVDVGCTAGSDGEFTIGAIGSNPFLFDENGNTNFNGVFTGYSAGSYTVQVTDANSCVSSIGVTLGTTSTAPPSGSCTIATIPTSSCVGSNIVVSTTIAPGATGYSWSVPAGTLINGVAGPLVTASNTVTLTLGALPPNSSAWEICAFAKNGCGQTNTNCKYIRGSLSLPSAISGSTVACPSTNGVYSTTAVTGASSYLWTGTNGITFTGSGTSITANFPGGFTSGTICVAGQLPCGYTGPARCISVSNGTPLLGTMSGTFSVCPNTNGVAYSVPVSAGASTYNWTVPTGATLASGAGTNSVTVDFGPGYTSGSICVVAQSVCGINSSPRCRTISSNKPATPGNVTGAATGICGQTITYSIAAVAGATSYTWTPPAGASLSTPNGNNSVDVTYSPGFTTGNLCVTANNGCGSSTPRCIIAKGTPSNPGIISGPSTVCASQSGTVYSIAPVFGATGYIWATPSGTTINSGQGTTSINVDWGSNGGTVAVTAQSACGNSGTRTLAVVMNCKVSGSQLPGSELNVYPNPVSTQLTIELDAAKSGAYSVEIVDLAGRVVYSEVINAAAGINNNVIDVADYAKGVYTLSVKNNDGFVKQVRVAVQ